LVPRIKKGINLFRIGFGYDVHRLVEGRPLILGGVEVPHPFGLEGHSDADVLTHAIMDAIIGALGAGDIGQHFPDTDPKYKGAASLSMLKTVMGLVKNDGYRLNNLDATITAQAPKLVHQLPDMRERLAEKLEASVAQVNIKATTSEGLGFCGKREGMEAFAVVSLVKAE
jgi:2-C-methyl-D-erythritol 2,4-cyclodiphosphate synthase